MARYRDALALGAVRALPEIYRTAGARLTFDAGAIGELVELVEARSAGSGASSLDRGLHRRDRVASRS